MSVIKKPFPTFSAAIIKAKNEIMVEEDRLLLRLLNMIGNKKLSIDNYNTHAMILNASYNDNTSNYNCDKCKEKFYYDGDYWCDDDLSCDETIMKRIL
jgi:hypothetical protein